MIVKNRSKFETLQAKMVMLPVSCKWKKMKRMKNNKHIITHIKHKVFSIPELKAEVKFSDHNVISRL